MHLSRDKQTFGCALHNAHFDTYDSGTEYTQVTIAPYDWKIRFIDNTTADKDYLAKTRLAVLGDIKNWKGKIHQVNYTLSHHVETNEERDWEQLKGRLCKWTGNPGGNDNGAQLESWTHGIYEHALSKMELCDEPESVAWAGIV